MLVLNEQALDALLQPDALIEALRQAFADGVTTPPRNVVEVPGNEGRLLLTMPAFALGGEMGVVKLATVYPDNAKRSLPTIQGLVVVFSDRGEVIAILDGAAVTQRRTAAASALAGDYLARSDATQHLVIGTGALAPFLAEAHATVRPIERVAIWGRTPSHIQRAVEATRQRLARRVAVEPAADLQSEVGNADIVSCATSAMEPVLSGRWLKPGAHVDLVGSFSPKKREADDIAVFRSRVFVDTREGARSEAGDLLDPINRGVIGPDHVKGDLADLVLRRVGGRTCGDEITLFKSVGTAIEDLAAARLAVQLAQQ